jgi:hypothetical protein
MPLLQTFALEEEMKTFFTALVLLVASQCCAQTAQDVISPTTAAELKQLCKSYQLATFRRKNEA